MHYSDSHYTAVGRGAADEGRADVQKKKKTSKFSVSRFTLTWHRASLVQESLQYFFFTTSLYTSARTHTRAFICARVCKLKHTLYSCRSTGVQCLIFIVRVLIRYTVCSTVKVTRRNYYFVASISILPLCAGRRHTLWLETKIYNFYLTLSTYTRLVKSFFFFFCNYQPPRNKNWKTILFPSDFDVWYFFYIATQLIDFTVSFLHTLVRKHKYNFFYVLSTQ